jgi:hypothetical protein
MNLAAFVIVTLVVIAVIVIISTAPGRRGAGSAGARACPGCGTAQPHHAKFCRRCGKSL